MYDIIDIHAHIYPEMIAEKATDGISKFYTLKMHSVGTSSSLLQSGRKANIKKYVINSVATTAKQVSSINNFISSECCKHPNEFIGLMAMHPEFSSPIEEIERSSKLGLKGVKIHPDVQRFNMDDERMFPVYDYIQDKMPILIHCGDYRYDYSHPKRLVSILKRFPRLKVIAAHFGGWSIFDLAVEYLLSENCYLDTSSSFAFLGSERSKELIRKYSADRIVFGVDFPMWQHKPELDFLLNLGLTDEENKKILYKNAKNLLNL